MPSQGQDVRLSSGQQRPGVSMTTFVFNPQIPSTANGLSVSFNRKDRKQHIGNKNT